MINGLRPPLLDEYGVLAAIEHLVSQVQESEGVAVVVHSDGDLSRLTAQLDHAIYRIVQESLTNAVRHSNSDKVEVRLARHGRRILVEVEDWGIGFEPPAPRGDCFGLEAIRERATLLGGQATIDATPGKGTRISVEIPLFRDEFAEK